MLRPCRCLLPSWVCVLKPSVLVLGFPLGDFYNTFFPQGLITITWCCIRKEHHLALPGLLFFSPSWFICVSQYLEELYLSRGFMGRAAIEELFLLLFRFWESLKQPEVDQRAFRCSTVPGNFCGLHNPASVLAELKQLEEVNWCPFLQYSSQKKNNYSVLFGNWRFRRFSTELPSLYEGCQADLLGESLK